MDYMNDPNYWWLRLQYALTGERSDDVEAAREHLYTLGYELHLGAGKAEETTHFREYAEPTPPLDAMRFAVVSLTESRRLIEFLLDAPDRSLSQEELLRRLVFPQILESAGVLVKQARGWRLTSREAAQKWLEETELPPEWRDEVGDE